MATKKTTTPAFTDDERAAMKDRASEVKRARGGKDVDEEPAVLEKIAEMPEADRVMAERIHAIIKQSAPGLKPKLWYGMPAYYRDGKVLIHFQTSTKFKTRYCTLGFSDQAHLDDGTMWPNAYALTSLTEADEARIAELVKRAHG